MMIPEFYQDSEIFLTGGSGVVGKALIDKLLRSCNVRRIYVLLRSKKGLSMEERLAKICKAKVFTRLRAEKPDELKKIVPIPGDCALPNLGISPESAKLMENVSIVFHCAATVRFDEPILVALSLNVAGTLEALKFAETLQNLKIFMHVSTFFSNPYLECVENKLYDSPLDWKMCLKLLQDESKSDLLDILTKKMITGFPNTYTFTKNLAESVVNDFRHRLPVVIFRPSVLISCISDPEPGFPPTVMGAMGLFLLADAGIVKSTLIRKDVRLDLIPQDFCVKLMLFYGLKGVQEYKKDLPEAAPVYLCTSYPYSLRPFTDVNSCLEKYDIWVHYPILKSFLVPGVVHTSCWHYYMLLVFTKQLLPALLADQLLRLFGQKPVIMSINRKVFLALRVMEPFLFNSYRSSGITHLDELSAIAKGTDFDITDDIRRSQTDEGLKRNCTVMMQKLREVLMNETPDSLPQAIKYLRIKRIIYHVMCTILAYYIIRWFYRIVSHYIEDNFA